MARRCFYSFYYKPDVIRAAKIRNIGVIEGNRPATDNDWEKIRTGGKPAIRRWIAGQLRGKTCTIVLIGSNTADRPLVRYEIAQSWNANMGVVGINIHGITNLDGRISTRGKNPFDYVTHGATKKKLSSIVKRYNPVGSNSKERYAWIEKYLSGIVEVAIRIRKEN